MTGKYEQLKSELRRIENELENHKSMSYKSYSYLINKKAALQQEIDKLPLLYEILYDNYGDKATSKYLYLNKDKAYKKLNKLNDALKYEKLYFIKIRELDG